MRHVSGFYFSASDVLTPEQAYIVSEIPTKKTEEDFWQMVLESGAEAIVALVTTDGEAYWSSSHFPQKVGSWLLKQQNEEVVATSPFLPNHRLIKRMFTATHLHAKTKRTISHYQYENWPDHGEPEGTLFLKLLKMVEETHKDGTKPLVVHCAAGIGRSGTFVAAHSLRLDVLKIPATSKSGSVNVFWRILEMRMQRPRMLSRPVQVRSVLSVVQVAIHERPRKKRS